MPATFDKILGKPLLHTHAASDISGLVTGITNTVSSVNSNTTLTSTSANVTMVDATNSTITIFLPQASTVTNLIFTVKKTDSTLNTVTLDGYNNELIDGSANLIIQFQNSAVDVVSNGSGWYII